jgi:hypothetical protein
VRGEPWLAQAAQRVSFLPGGHPEAFNEAFANVYLGVGEAIRARQAQRSLEPLEGDYPTLRDGARGVRFIEKTVHAAHAQEKWTRWAD